MGYSEDDPGAGPARGMVIGAVIGAVMWGAMGVVAFCVWRLIEQVQR